MKFLLFTTIVTITGLLSLPAAAWHEEDHKLTRAQELRKPDFDSADTNKDGILNNEETNSYILMKFSSIDLDKNGEISKEEKDEYVSKFKENNEEYLGKFTEKWAKKLNLNLKKANENGDKVITRDEYKDFFSARFKGMDRNKDGEINLLEFRRDSANSPIKR